MLYTVQKVHSMHRIWIWAQLGYATLGRLSAEMCSQYKQG